MADIVPIYVNADGFYEEADSATDSIEFVSFKTANNELTDTKLGNLIGGGDGSAEHTHDSVYFRENEHIDTSAGAADAGKPIILDASGKLDESFIDTAGLEPVLNHDNLAGVANSTAHLEFPLLDGTRAYTGDQSMGGNKITNLADPTADQDAVNLRTLQNYQNGLKPKAACRVATTANVNIATDLEAGDSIDGITLVAGDRILLKDQTLPEQNGIYIASATGAAVRAEDFNEITPIDEINGAYTAIQEGSENAGKAFVQTGTVVTVDVDPINFVFFNAADSITASNGLVKVGQDIQIDPSSAGDGLSFAGGVYSVNVDDDTLGIDTDILKVKANGIGENEIDFGTGAGQVDGGDIPLVDSGNFFTNDNVEDALQQLAGQISQAGVEYTVGVGGVTKGDALFLSADNTVSTYSGINNAEEVIGLAAETKLAGEIVKSIANDVKLDGFAGLVAGTKYYWDGSAISSTIPSGGGSHVWKVGVGADATTLHTQIIFIRKNKA